MTLLNLNILNFDRFNLIFFCVEMINNHLVILTSTIISSGLLATVVFSTPFLNGLKNKAKAIATGASTAIAAYPAANELYKDLKKAQKVPVLIRVLIPIIRQAQIQILITIRALILNLNLTLILITQAMRTNLNIKKIFTYCLFFKRSSISTNLLMFLPISFVDFSSVLDMLPKTPTSFHKFFLGILILSLVTLLSFFDLFGHFFVLYLIKNTNIKARYPKFKRVINFYEKSRYLFLVYEIIFVIIVYLSLIGICISVFFL